MASLTIGSLILFDFEYGLTALPLRIIFASLAGICILFVGILLLVAKAHTKPKAMGLAALEGQSGAVLAWEGDHGQIKVRGERWSARTEVPRQLARGDRVRVTRAHGLVLDIAPESSKSTQTP
jgi:membrane-bound serine protease (ClpP class)